DERKQHGHHGQHQKRVLQQRRGHLPAVLGADDPLPDQLQDVDQAGVHHGREKMRAVGFKATFQDDALVGRMPAAAHTPTSAVINEMELLRASRAMATAPSTPACSPSAETTTLGG